MPTSSAREPRTWISSSPVATTPGAILITAAMVSSGRRACMVSPRSYFVVEVFMSIFPVTVTVGIVLMSGSSRITGTAIGPASTRTATSFGRKPVRRTRSTQAPTGTPEMRNEPSSPACAPSAVPSTWMSASRAGSLPPSTRPVRVPLWAPALPGAPARTRRTRKANAIGRNIGRHLAGKRRFHGPFVGPGSIAARRRCASGRPGRRLAGVRGALPGLRTRRGASPP